MQLLRHVRDPDRPTEAASGEVEPGQRVHRRQVGGHRADLAHDQPSVGGRQQRADTVAQSRQVVVAARRGEGERIRRGRGRCCWGGRRVGSGHVSTSGRGLAGSDVPGRRNSSPPPSGPRCRCQWGGHRASVPPLVAPAAEARRRCCRARGGRRRQACPAHRRRAGRGRALGGRRPRTGAQLQRSGTMRSGHLRSPTRMVTPPAEERAEISRVASGSVATWTSTPPAELSASTR